jgi:TrmH family RNA methyltransferase
MKKIASRDNASFKTLVKLAESSRERRKTGQTLLDGPHLLATYLAAVGRPRSIAVSESGLANAEVCQLLDTAAGTEIIALPDTLFAQISGVTTPVGIVALIETPKPVAAPAQPPFCLLLEDVQDPGNVGSILRSAAAAGVRHVFASAGCAYAWAPRVLRAAMGAHFLLTIHERADLAGFAHGFNGCVVATVARGAKPLFQADLTGRLALMIGNEGAGLSESLLQVAHETVSIPMPGRAESLNAAAAAAICLYERVRQCAGKQAQA